LMKWFQAFQFELIPNNEQIDVIRLKNFFAKRAYFARLKNKWMSTSKLK
jgi:hypothetical protein